MQDIFTSFLQFGEIHIHLEWKYGIHYLKQDQVTLPPQKRFVYFCSLTLDNARFGIINGKSSLMLINFDNDTFPCKQQSNSGIQIGGRLCRFILAPADI